MPIIHRHLGKGIAYYQFVKGEILSHRFYWTRGDGVGRLNALKAAREFKNHISDMRKKSLQTWSRMIQVRRRQRVVYALMMQPREPALNCTLDFSTFE